MRFLILCKTDQASYAGDAPHSGRGAALVRLLASLREAGVLRLAGELLPASSGARLVFDGREWSTHPGPFGAPDELVAAFALVDVRDRDEALTWAARWPAADGQEVEVREAGCSAGCVGFEVATGAPQDGRQRYMVLLKSDHEQELDVHPPPGIIAAMMRHNEEGARAGIVLAGEGLQPSSKGSRLRFAGGRHSLFDGPFTETKELVAGFWLIEAASLDAACDWARNYPYPRRGRVDVEVRTLAGAQA
ncbi:YciI family protein [Massilia horti]|nr:YciI family protein [Massilia horti]